MDILVTNNPLVEVQLKSKFRVDFKDNDLIGILAYVRDLVHKGHRLLTHPLAGSIKPNETPYKTVLITGTTDSVDTQSVIIIEECVFTAQKFTPKHIPEKYLNDLQMVDLSLIRSAVQ